MMFMVIDDSGLKGRTEIQQFISIKTSFFLTPANLPYRFIKHFLERLDIFFVVSEYVVGIKAVEYSDLRDQSIILVCY